MFLNYKLKFNDFTDDLYINIFFLLKLQIKISVLNFDFSQYIGKWGYGVKKNTIMLYSK
jgi:hypothetical protein